MFGHICKMRKYFLLVVVGTLLPQGALAQAVDEDPGFLGSEGGGRIAQPAGPARQPIGPAVFDHSPTFVPPENLKIVDTYLREVISARELADELETVSVTPDGELESLILPPNEAERLLKGIEAIRTLEAGFEGVEPGPREQGQSDFMEGEYVTESVIGPDTRTRITQTTTYPFRTMGRIDIGCTGTLIGPRHVLTAGHCVYNISTDKWYTNLNFTPGQNGATKPYGTIAWARAISVKGWTQNHKRDYDYAMIVLKEDVGNKVGWLGYGCKNPLPKYNVNINGYPGDKPSGTLWHAFCGLQIIQAFRLYYACDTFGGMSGSAVYVFLNGNRIIYGIHAYGVDSTGLNGATRITQAVFENLKRWKSTY